MAMQPAAVDLRRDSRRDVSKCGRAATGLVASLIDLSVNQPLVALKTQLQSSKLDLLSIVKLIKTNPTWAWKGFVPMYLSYGPTMCFGFYLKPHLEESLERRGWKAGDVREGVAAIASGSIMAFLWTAPMEALMVRRQVALREGTYTGYHRLAQVGGAPALWRGVGAIAFREGVFAAMASGWATRMLQPSVERVLGQNNFSDGLTPFLVGAIGAVITHPADTIKTKLQANPVGSSWVPGTNAVNMWKQEGKKVGWMFRGVFTRIVSYGLAVFTYDMTRDYIYDQLRQAEVPVLTEPATLGA